MVHFRHPIKIVVTGIGLTTGLGNNRESSWTSLCEGTSAIRDLPTLQARGAPEARDVGHDQVEPVLAIASRVAREALRDAKLTNSPQGDSLTVKPDRVATIFGLSKGGLRSLGLVNTLLRQKSAQADWIGSLWRSRCFPNAGCLSLEPQSTGPKLSPVAACATGLVAAIQGADLIRLGVCDIALCGAADASLDPLILGAFLNMRALAREETDPTRAVRPWDRNRSGFLVGEGAAVLVLEREDHAKARGVLPYAEFAGGAFGSDAYHMTNLNPDPSGLAHLLGIALKNSDVSTSDLDYINVHGTATRQNDPLECRAIRQALGSHADSVSCSANKAQIGHLLGAAGAAELAITCLAIRDGFIPPTLNLDDPDPACDLDGTPHVGKYRKIRTALKISIGFGGHLAAAVLRNPDGPRRTPILQNPAPNSS